MNTLERIEEALKAAVSALSAFIPGAVKFDYKSGDDPVTEVHLSDLFTAVLLIGQFRQLRAVSLLVLGTAYLFAGIYLFHSYSGKDGNPYTLSYDDIVIAYSGSSKGSRLEAALRGPIADELRSLSSGRAAA